MWLLLLPNALAGTLCLTPELREHPPLGVTADFRPNATGFVDSDVYPIRVHYRRPEDAERAADLVLPAAELSWAVEIDQMGWPAPPPDAGVGGSDAYDLYLTNEGTFGGAYTFGFGPDVTPDDGWYSVATYIALDDRWIDDADMLVFVAHELNHALQYTIDAGERRVFPWECTAEAMTDLVDDASDAYVWEIGDFQRYPFLSMLFDGYSDEVYAYDDYSYYEYGGSIFATFLEERFGTKDGTTLLAWWDAMAQPDMGSEPDFLDGLATIDPAFPSAAAVYTEFAVWRMFVASQDDGAHFEEGSLFYEDAIPGVEDHLTLAEADGYTAQPRIEPYDLGVSYYEVDVGAGSDDTLHVEVDGDPSTQWGIAWAVWQATGPAVTGTALGGATVAADLPLTGGTRVELGVVNAGPVDRDAEGDVPQRPFTVTLSVLPATTTPTTTPTGGDTGTAVGPVDTADPPHVDDGERPEDDEGGCTCASSGAPGGAWLVGLLLLARRRR